MNKGRNFFILMACLLVLGMLTFLTQTRTRNSSGVVDNVRYILKSSINHVKNYEFYFTDDTVMIGTLEKNENHYRLTVYIRDTYDETIQEYLTQPYAYYYVISGSDKKGASVEWHYREDLPAEEQENAPYERFTEQVFLSMIYGKDSYINIWQAILVALFAVLGGTIIAKAEELWHILYRKREEEDPVWEDMNGIKRGGVAVLILDAVLLIVFVVL